MSGIQLPFYRHFSGSGYSTPKVSAVMDLIFCSFIGPVAVIGADLSDLVDDVHTVDDLTKRCVFTYLSYGASCA